MKGKNGPNQSSRGLNFSPHNESKSKNTEFSISPKRNRWHINIKTSVPGKHSCLSMSWLQFPNAPLWSPHRDEKITPMTSTEVIFSHFRKLIQNTSHNCFHMFSRTAPLTDNLTFMCKIAGVPQLQRCLLQGYCIKPVAQSSCVTLPEFGMLSSLSSTIYSECILTLSLC